MKRIFLFTLLISVVLALPVTAAYATQATTPTMLPGCNPQMWGYLEDQANVVRARNRAYEREILNRQPSALYLTCFDQAMVISSRLGAIFSDNLVTAPPPADAAIVPPMVIAYPDWGASQPTLAMDLNGAAVPPVVGGVNAMFNSWLDTPITATMTAPAPAVALFNFLPQWLEPQLPTQPVAFANQLTQLVAAQQSVIASVLAFQAGGDVVPVSNYISDVTTLNGIVLSLPTFILQGLMGENQTYTTDYSKMMTDLGAVISERGGPMGTALAALVASANPATFKYTCTRVDDLWDTMDPAYTQSPQGDYQAGTFYPPAPAGPNAVYYPFSPYYTLQAFLTDATTDGGSSAPSFPTSPAFPTGATTPLAQIPVIATYDFIEELGDVTDNTALEQALADLVGQQAPLSKAGNSTIWPTPPTFNCNGALCSMSAQDVINQM